MIPTALVARLLQLTAVVNVVGGLASLVLPELNVALLLGEGITLDPVSLGLHRLVWAFVAAMGVGYAIAARDPERQTALVVCGGLGKSSAVVVWAWMALDGVSGPAMWPAMAFDGALGVVFLLWALGRRGVST